MISRDNHGRSAEAGVSVAMATYNGERFLRAQLDSLAAQELPPAELVACDDGSTDATVDILADFAATAPFPVRIHVNPANLGWRANFMQAASLSRAALIAFCDQDDVWYPRKLDAMAGLLADPSVLLAYHDADLMNASGGVFGRLRAHDHDVSRRPPLTWPIHWESPLGLTMVFRRSLLRFAQYWPLSVDPAKPTGPAAHDQWFFNLATCLGVVAYTPDPLLGYRQHGGNAVGFDPAKRSGAVSNTDQAASRLAGELARVAAFCTVLMQAGVGEQPEFQASIAAALARSTLLRDRLALRLKMRSRRSILDRLKILVGLIASRSYDWREPWRLGYSDLVADLRIVAAGSCPLRWCS